MADQVRVFVSHHHSPDEDAFTARLVSDLKAGGADVWVDTEGITSEDFVRKISEGLAGRQWLILVLTPASATSPWVQREVNAALNEVTARRMLGVIPIVAALTPESDIPVLWRSLHRYDGTEYEHAREALLRALGLSAQQAASSHQPSPSISSGAPYPVPARLGNLGYHGWSFAGTPVYLPPLITIPAGPFLMGSDRVNDRKARDDELPQYWVEVAAFQIAKYPVTVAEYALAVATKAVQEPRKYTWEDRLPGITWAEQMQHPDTPVLHICWEAAMAYTSWLVATTGQRGWRLPTEAEWEKAARWDPQHRVSRIYPWGDSFDKDRYSHWKSGHVNTTPVGTYAASDATRSGASVYGVEDMVGTVYEWTSSLYRPYPYVPSDGREDLKSGEWRTMRGGSSGSDDAQFVRAASRYSAPTSGSSGRDAWYNKGFRLVLGLGTGS